MERINYKSDFDFILELNDGAGRSLGWPDFDFVALLFTNNPRNCFVASSIGGVTENCFNDNGRIHVVADGHGLGPGALKCSLRLDLPNGIYGDGLQRVVSPLPLDIELVTGCGDAPSTAEVEMALPLVKGDKGDAFTYADFTAAEIAELQRPATEAAALLTETVNDAIRNTETATAEAVSKSEAAIGNAVVNAKAATDSANVAAWEAHGAAQRADDSALNANGAAESASIMAAKADGAASTANSAASSATAAATSANAAASYATEQGNYAKGIGEGLSAEVDKKQNKLTVSEDLQLYDNAMLSLSEMAKKRLFIDMWNSIKPSVYKYNEASGYFEFNMIMHSVDISIKDIQYAEALVMINNRGQGGSWDGLCTNIKRVNIFPTNAYNPSVSSCGLFCTNNSNIIICVAGENPDSYISPSVLTEIYNCSKLIAITGRFSIYNNVTLKKLPSLREISILSTSKDGLNVDLSCTPVISLESIKHSVEQSTKTLTLTLHPDVYAKITDESNPDYAQWHPLLAAAEAKNISFATV